MDSLKDLSFSSDSQLTSSYQTKLACQCCSRLVSSQSCFDLLAPLWHEGGLEPAVFKAGFELQQSMRSSHILEGVAEMSDVPALLTHSHCLHCPAAGMCQLCLEKLLLVLHHLTPKHDYSSTSSASNAKLHHSFSSGKVWNCKYTSEHNSTQHSCTTEIDEMSTTRQNDQSLKIFVE